MTVMVGKESAPPSERTDMKLAQAQRRKLANLVLFSRGDQEFGFSVVWWVGGGVLSSMVVFYPAKFTLEMATIWEEK